MKRIAICMIMAVCSICLAVTEPASIDEANGKTVIPQCIENISKLNEKEQLQLVETLVETRVDMQEKLLKQLKQLASNISTTEKCCIIKILGYYRYEEAVPMISKYIDIKYEEVPDPKRMPTMSPYPAVEALVRIGTHAIPVMIMKIETSDDESVVKLAVRVIRSVYGDELAKLYFNMQIEKQTDAIKKEKLVKAMELIK